MLNGFNEIFIKPQYHNANIMRIASNTNVFIINNAMYREWNKSYKMVSFEQEAYASEHDNNYIENRHMFTGWLKYL